MFKEKKIERPKQEYKFNNSDNAVDLVWYTDNNELILWETEWKEFCRTDERNDEELAKDLSEWELPDMVEDMLIAQYLAVEGERNAVKQKIRAKLGKIQRKRQPGFRGN